jgi:hypothetical protein
VFYQSDSASPIFEELESIFVKTAGIADQIRRALVTLAGRITVAALDGSAGAGDFEPRAT